MFMEKDLLESGMQQVPIIAVLGPRQSGKSTLLKNAFFTENFVETEF